MNKLCNALDLGQWTLIGISITDLNQVLNSILLIVSIVLGILSIVLKVVKAGKDGKITEEELNDIQKDVDDLNNKLGGK